MKQLLENWRTYVNEVSGQGLDRYATLISREVIKALKPLRYVIERLDKEERFLYLKGNFSVTQR